MKAAPHVSAVLGLALIGLLIAGCRTQVQRPAVIYDLTASGVVEAVEEIEGGGLRLSLASGESIDLFPGAVPLYGEIILPGELILVGTTGSAVAYATARERDPCYVLNQPALDDGAHVVFGFGLRLPKAPAFDPGPVDDGQFLAGFGEGGFCINSAGEVVSYGS